MRVLIAGATGFIGSAVAAGLGADGHDISALVRAPRASRLAQIVWDPMGGALDPASISGFDAVVNLAGESIACRWTEEKRVRLRESRAGLTRRLSEALADSDTPPEVFICASAAGYYGNRGDEILTEESASGDGFLAELCRDWESAADPARARGIRVVHLRLGIVLGASGGALATIAPIFRLGLGGAMGRGTQWWSWIALDDVVGAVRHVLARTSIAGPVNAATPNPVRNNEFTRALASAVGRRARFRVPAAALRLVYGDMAEESLLASQRLQPGRLLASDYRFQYPILAEAFEHALGEHRPS